MREQIYLVSSAGTGYFRIAYKNKRITTDKLKLKKYDPKARKHVLFTESSKVSKVKRKKN